MNDTCWAQLGIEPTTQRNDITEAYQRKRDALHAAEGSDVQLEMLEKAYQRALLLALSEEQVPEQPPQQQMSERVMQPEETQKSTQSRATLHAAVWFVVLATVVILAAKPFDNGNERTKHIHQTIEDLCKRSAKLEVDTVTVCGKPIQNPANWSGIEKSYWGT